MRPDLTRRLLTTISLIGLAGCGAASTAVNTGGATATAIASPPPGTPSPTAATPTPTTVPSHAPAPSTPGTVSVVVAVAQTALGSALVAASDGRTLYTFNSDKAGSGMTACNSGCVDEWPPLMATHIRAGAGPGATGQLGTIVRRDGGVQLAYNGMALYFFAGDTGPAQTHGQYPGWSIARP